MPPALELISVVKDYHGLRPLRVRDLVVSTGEVVALGGLDTAAAEVLTSLVTGATLPDEGSVRVFGQDTVSISDADSWLAGLDCFGILSDRVALVGGLSLRQNIAIALTLDLEPLPADIAGDAGTLGAEVGIAGDLLDAAAGNAPPAARFRTRLARAVALSPRILLAEHPTASVPRAEVAAVASDFFRVVRARRLSIVVVTADPDVAGGADRHVVLDPVTGALRRRGLRAWFS